MGGLNFSGTTNMYVSCTGTVALLFFFSVCFIKSFSRPTTLLCLFVVSFLAGYLDLVS